MKSTPQDIAVDANGLRVEDRTGRAVLDDISFRLGQGDRLGIVGDSGAGKTTLALSLMGHFRPGLRHAAGTIRCAGWNALAASAREVRDFRRRTVSYLGQDPAAALTPSLRVGEQVRELLLDERDEQTVYRRLAAVGLPGDCEFARKYPHEVSGGQLQRVALARALSPNPAILILDEPTSSLDIVTRKMIAEEIQRQADALGLTLIVVSHDLKLVAHIANRLLVLREGQIVEQGDVYTILSKPESPYTSNLVAAFDLPTKQRVAARNERLQCTPALRVRGLSAAYRSRGFRQEVVKGVDFDIHPGECVAVVGLSGAGKSTVAACLLGLREPDAGSVAVDGVLLAPRVRDRANSVRHTLQIVPQDPEGSLNPRRRVGDTLCHALRAVQGLSRNQATAAAQALMARVGLAANLFTRFPRELSGGERQRIAIARALAAQPRVLICDEVTSALDVTVEASVLELIDDLRRDEDMAVLLIAHDLRVVRKIADRAIVLHNGTVCERIDVPKLDAASRHALTRSILQADQPLASILRKSSEQAGGFEAVTRRLHD